MSRTLHVTLIWCYFILFYICDGDSIRCGHDDVEYDITRNDDIEPLNEASLSSISGSTTAATSWLLHEIKGTHAKAATVSTPLQTFSSRKNTKPHRHHTSIHAFEHNIHQRHHPMIDKDEDENEDENDSIDRSIWSPFRIHYDSDSLLSSWQNAEEAQHFADNVIPAAMHYLERSLFVRPVLGKLKLSRPCVKYVVDEKTDKKHCVELKWNYEQCGSHVTIPQEDFEDTEICELDDKTTSGVKDCKILVGGQGRDADIIIYFSGDSDYGCSDVYGYSAYCHSNKYDRPIAGFVNLCEDTLVQKNRIFTWEQKVTLIVHEVFHVLGFSSTGFAYFRYNDAQRRPRTPRDKSDGHPLRTAAARDKSDGYQYGSNTIQYHEVRDKFATFIVLPTVVKHAQKFYSCDSVIGIELEDFGGHDTAASHWEQRILGYEFMIGYIPPAAPFSVFSFAVLQDSGWYKVNWKYASQQPYGKQFGCDWIDKKCLSGDGAKDMLDPFTFCTSDIDYGCAKDHIAISNCQIEEYNFNLPQYFQYFNKNNIGGRLEYADYCPMYYHYNNGDCRFVDASIKHKRFGATITPQSKCTIISHPDYHYLNLKMQGLDASAILNDDEEDITSAAAAAAAHRRVRKKKALPKELGVCYKQECFTDASAEWSGLRIQVWNMEYEENEWMTCWKDVDDGKYKITQLHEYDIRCPIYADICYDLSPWLCNGHGMLDKVKKTCVCNAGYIGCDCLYDDTQQNRNKYPYSDHEKCQQYNIIKEGVFDKAPPLNDRNNALHILHDIIWNEIDVHFDEYHLILFNVEMDLESNDKYIDNNKEKKEMNLDFIQVAQSIKMLFAIPLNIDYRNVWMSQYSLLEKELHHYNIEVVVTYMNQQRMSHKQLKFQIKKILHKLFAQSVTMQTIADDNDDDDDDVEDAKMDYMDHNNDGISITPVHILRHHSGSNSDTNIHSLTLFIISIMVL